MNTDIKPAFHPDNFTQSKSNCEDTVWFNAYMQFQCKINCISVFFLGRCCLSHICCRKSSAFRRHCKEKAFYFEILEFSQFVSLCSIMSIVLQLAFLPLLPLCFFVPLQRDKTFVTVEIYDNRTETWEVVYNDASWETRLVYIQIF